MLLHVAECIRMSDASFIRVDGLHQRGFIAIQDKPPTDSPFSRELDVDADVRPEDVEPEKGDAWGDAHPAPEELFLRGILRRFEDGGGLLENPDGIILLNFSEDFSSTLLDIPVRVSLKDVHGLLEGMQPVG